MTASTEVTSQPVSDRADLDQMTHRLVQMAARGLVSMFNPETQLCCYSLQKNERGLVRVGISHRYTMMSLLGLQKLQVAGQKSPIAILPALNKLLANLDWVNNIGDLGVLLWTCAKIAPNQLEELDRRLDLSTALARFRDAQQRRTVELAWFLTGLSYAKLALPERKNDCKNLAIETYQLLLANQVAQGIFAFHASGRKSGIFNRGRVGCFADQVYPIYAFTRYSRAFNNPDALKKASECAKRICEAQGPLGQWWWHYDSWTGKVIGGYPVFSVHQHAMAPMALLALGEATQTDFDSWIYKGLGWLTNNELTVNMEDNTANVVWRCIAPSKFVRLFRIARNLMEQTEDSKSPVGLKVLHECRPYELGWLLYAFAN